MTAISEPIAEANREFFEQKLAEKLDPNLQPYIKQVMWQYKEPPLYDSYGRVTHFYVQIGD